MSEKKGWLRTKRIVTSRRSIAVCGDGRRSIAENLSRASVSNRMYIVANRIILCLFIVFWIDIIVGYIYGRFIYTITIY